jgi:hypothetical protein
MTAGARGEVTPRGRAMGWWIERPAQGFSTFSDDGRMERCLDEPLSWFPARIPQTVKRDRGSFSQPGSLVCLLGYENCRLEKATGGC